LGGAVIEGCLLVLKYQQARLLRAASGPSEKPAVHTGELCCEPSCAEREHKERDGKLIVGKRGKLLM
jgi:hypothetical protein